MKVRKGDQVVIIKGKDRGRQGKVKMVLPAERRLVVEGANFAKRHRKSRGQMDQGGIVEFEAPIPLANVMVICPHCREAVRLGFDFLPEGGKVRICRGCGEALD